MMTIDVKKAPRVNAEPLFRKANSNIDKIDKKPENVNLNPYILDEIVRIISIEVSSTLARIMAELRNQAAYRSTLQAERIRTGALNAYDLTMCWGAMRRHAVDPWAFIEARLPEKFSPMSKDEHRAAIEAITLGESWALLKQMIVELGGSL